MIRYANNLDHINEAKLEGGFFAGWPNPPSAVVHMQILKGSYLVWLAIESESDNVVGFVNAISDGVLSAYIPLIEVLPEYHNQGIGKELMKRMLDSLKHLYMIDLLCDAKLQAYYRKLGMIEATGMFVRNYDRQAGDSPHG